MSKKLVIPLVILEDSVLWVLGAIAGVMVWVWHKGDLAAWIMIVGLLPFLWRLVSTVLMIYRSQYVYATVTNIGKKHQGLKECTLEYLASGIPKEVVLSVQGAEYKVGAQVIVLVSKDARKVRLVGLKNLFEE